MQRRLAAILAADVVGYSRLMGADEMGTITALKSHRRELVDSAIAEHRGRIVKTTGDGMLVEFASVVDAVSCSVHIQRSMVRRNAASRAGQADRVPDRHQSRRHHHRRRRYFRRRGQYRRAPGNAVRARRRLHLKGGQRPDQGQAFDRLRRSRRAGSKEHFARGRSVRTYRKGYRGAPRVGRRDAAETVQAAAIPYEQEIRFCQSKDGVQLAYARTGQGPPLVKTGHWMTHLEYDFESPIWRHFYHELSRDQYFLSIRRAR